MNNILGLLLKDLLVFRNYKKNIIISIISFIVIIFISSMQYDMLLYGSLIFLLFLGMNSISTFSYDEIDSTDKYLLSLPIKRKEIVLAKYLFVFLDAFISLIFGLFISIIASLVMRHSLDNLINTIQTLSLTFTAVSFLLCSDIPCIYKWGVEKGRMQAIIVPVFLVIILGFIFTITVLIFPELLIHNYLDKIILFSPFICIILNILIYYISYKISCYIFNKKDL